MPTHVIQFSLPAEQDEFDTTMNAKEWRQLTDIMSRWVTDQGHKNGGFVHASDYQEELTRMKRMMRL